MFSTHGTPAAYVETHTQIVGMRDWLFRCRPLGGRYNANLTADQVNVLARRAEQLADDLRRLLNDPDITPATTHRTECVCPDEGRVICDRDAEQCAVCRQRLAHDYVHWMGDRYECEACTAAEADQVASPTTPAQALADDIVESFSEAADALVVLNARLNYTNSLSTERLAAAADLATDPARVKTAVTPLYADQLLGLASDIRQETRFFVDARPL